MSVKGLPPRHVGSTYGERQQIQARTAAEQVQSGGGLFKRLKGFLDYFNVSTKLGPERFSANARFLDGANIPPSLEDLEGASPRGSARHTPFSDKDLFSQIDQILKATTAKKPVS